MIKMFFAIIHRFTIKSNKNRSTKCDKMAKRDRVPFCHGQNRPGPFLVKWVCGMANANGGIIYIGKDDKGEVVGINNGKKLVKEIPNQIKNAMGIIPEVKIKEKNGLMYLTIKIEKYPVPISYQGKLYLRSGSNNNEVTGVELERFMLEKAGKRWEDLPVQNASFDDLSKEALKVFKEKALKSARLKKEDLEIDDKNLLRNLGLYDGKYLNKAAILLFGKNPNQWIVGAYQNGVMIECKPSKKYIELLKAVKSKNVPINVHKNFGKIESNILEIILECPEITQANIASILKITPKTVQRGISRLKEKEIIKRVGSNKKGYWEIKA